MEGSRRTRGGGDGDPETGVRARASLYSDQHCDDPFASIDENNDIRLNSGDPPKHLAWRENEEF